MDSQIGYRTLSRYNALCPLLEFIPTVELFTTALRVTACGTSGALEPSELPGPTAWIAVSGATRPPCVVEVSEA